MSIIDLKMILMFVMAAVPFTFAMRWRPAFATRFFEGMKRSNNFYALAYSMPYQDEMYVVRIASHQCGIIDEIHVEFYASIETVFTFLKQELERLEQPQPDLDIEELQRLDALLINFL